MSQDGTQGRYAGGSLAGGRYQLRDLLGEGGMASVYLAYDSALDRQVAIKTLHSELGREASFRERFRREAQAVAKLSHTNIVSVFDTGEGDLDGALMPYIVMEYVEGKPLGSVLQADVNQYGAMPADKALKVTADVLAALETSHEMGLVHRDIKPGNVMMTKRGVVKVMDFGIARAMQSGVTSMTQTGMVVGTPQYLSPEQALGRAVDARSDLYSVGIMLFQLLTGRLPFEADSPLAIAYAHVQEEPVAPSSINRSVSPAMDALVARALKKNPNERFPTAAAMRDEIARVMSAGQTGAPMIVPGVGPVSSGAGVSSAVFPPVDSGFQAPPQSLQQPYQAPHTPAPSPYAPQQQHAQGGYAYPQQQHTPPPAAQHHQQQFVAQTPPPYTISPAAPQVPAGNSGGGGDKRNTPVVVGAIAVALIAIGGLIWAIANNGDDKGGTEAGPSSSSSASASAKAGHKGPDRSRTIEDTKCKNPTKYYNDATKYTAPDFRYKDILSVKACIQAAGWKYKVVEKDEAVYGEDIVVEQNPAPSDKVDKEGTEFTLTVSTGNPE
ncbi:MULTISPECIES: protein kinase [unclassified Streptomyces]|uniref:protein kinase domain-containing protein n=1 Tax=unclassified Streptomyces TaxID=2593676 RepID=UPI00225764EB|nr:MULTISPECIES: protein kinase [unclassified Streptomyces]MCX4526912.1 protein kinase [Streptomyces sp. NBC_01551]MCX4542528.1 protein kinase [Streptomyces sp. NBC_01565]